MTPTKPTQESMAALLALAEKATPGPWKRCAHLEKNPCGCRGNRGFIYAPGIETGHICEMYHQEDRERGADLNPHLEGMPLPSREQVLADAAYIAAASPEVVAGLVAECQRLREALGALLAVQSDLHGRHEGSTSRFGCCGKALCEGGVADERQRLAINIARAALAEDR